MLAVERRVVEERAVLRVHDHQRTEPRRLGHRGRERVGRQVRELGDAGVQQEALEAEHPGLVQRRQVGEVVGHGTAPEAHVDERLPFGHRPLEVQGGQGRRRRHRVERHVQDRGHATSRGRPGRGREALPLGPARLVDVHVGVDQPRQQYLVVAERHHGRDRRHAVVRRHRGDQSARHRDARRHLRVPDDHASGAHHEISCHGRSSSRTARAAGARGGGGRRRP